MRKILPLVALLAASSLFLTWCNKTEVVDSVDETPAVYSNTSLDMWGIISATENHFPKSYTYSKYDFVKSENLWEGSHVYNRMDLWYLTPESEYITDREILSSWIEDWMIYTLMKATMKDGHEFEVLYINDPETLNFVAANIEDENITTNYQFSYEDNTSLTYSDLEWIAEKDFPTSGTYSKYDRTTEVVTTWDVVFPAAAENNITNITPDFPAVKEHTQESSWIEDWMIYTLVDVVFDDDSTWNILYINDPVTLNFVATTVEKWNYSINYQFTY